MKKEEQLLKCVADIGRQMIENGAEIARVEDSVRRICFSYGYTSIDVFCLPSYITVTIEDEDGNRHTDSRRVVSRSTDLNKLDLLNSLSRRVCSQGLDVDTFTEELKKIKGGRAYKLWVHILAGMVIASAFTLFFEGTVVDSLVAAAVGAVLELLIFFCSRAKMNKIVANVICSFVLCSMTFIAKILGIAQGVDAIIISNIFILVPGIQLTNSVRDLFSGDVISGSLSIVEACLITLAIAIGYMPAVLIFGGAL